MKCIKELSIIAVGSIFFSIQAYADERLTHIDDLTDYPPQILEEFNEYKVTCIDAMGDFHNIQYSDVHRYKGVPLEVQSGFITETDVTGDGINDYLVRYGKLVCDGQYSILWGNIGDAPYTVYMGTPSNNAYPISKNSSPGEGYPKLVINSYGYADIERMGMGGECGQKGNWSFAETQSCTFVERWNDQNKAFELIPTDH